MRRCASFFILLCSSYFLQAAEMKVEIDDATGWRVYTLTQGETTIRLVPEAGANVQSVVHRGAEYFHQPTELADLRGVRCGNPILYPTPNRIKGSSFPFEGKRYQFPPGGNGNFIHGLVHSEPFEVESAGVESGSAEMTCRLRFEPGQRPYELFPWKHDFRMTVRLSEGKVRWEYEVDNREGERNLPFGVALHPYIRYQGSRESAYLHVPAASLMESFQQLPSGKLLQLDGHPLDARQPVSLAAYNADDVFFGMQPDQPASLEFRQAGRRITFHASSEFTHLVVWTPDRPYLGIENQTCSTDAHNLASQGMEDVAHLQICPPGEQRTGHVEYVFE